jgi:hypothetical protein
MAWNVVSWTRGDGGRFETSAVAIGQLVVTLSRLEVLLRARISSLTATGI